MADLLQKVKHRVSNLCTIPLISSILNLVWLFLFSSTEKIAKLQEMYLYELSLPLSGIQEVYTEFLEFAESHSCQVDWEKINEVYHKSKDNLFAMLTFEDKLVSLDEKHHQDRAAAFSEYIEKGKSILNEQMLQVLYERMVSACCLDGKCSICESVDHIHLIFSRSTDLVQQ